MVKKIVIFIVLLLLIPFFLSMFMKEEAKTRATWWKFQSIDTMKYSRDLSREKLNDFSFDSVINMQVKNIVDTGATHVAIATPYDEEFYPILKRWVAAARRYNMNVWFRGNWSGWEGWFNYPKITRQEHIKKTKEFILKHRDIFADGDVFTACPECENGGPGDPRHNGDVAGYRKFLIDEYRVTKATFREVNKNVASNFNSMNGDVARVVMDKETTTALDGIVTIDHYVTSPEKLIADIKSISKSSGGKIVLGEFGAPIPDINGNLSEKDQALWIGQALSGLIQTHEAVGLNYWTNTGSSTALWRESGEAREAVEELTSFYKAHIVRVTVRDEAGFEVRNAIVSLNGKQYSRDAKGISYLPYFEDLKDVYVEAGGFFSKKILLTRSDETIIILNKKNEDFIFKLRKFINNLF